MAASTKRKSRSFSEAETTLLIAEWYKYPCLYDKSNKEYHDRNKRDMAKQQITKALLDAFGLELDTITGRFHTGLP